ncbi:hypothetical protein C8Q79DRAFT_1010277 [Trametes meyenii]|nr:hypothetical protein C8Q79DRAFT_1010277 [Trametes meyenii]
MATLSGASCPPPVVACMEAPAPSDELHNLFGNLSIEDEDSALVEELERVSKKSAKLIKSSEYQAPADPSITIWSWKMNEFKYYDIPSPFPTLARGLFTQDIKDDSGNVKHRIVVRGYDKFFNIGAVPWTTVSVSGSHSNLHPYPYPYALAQGGVAPYNYQFLAQHPPAGAPRSPLSPLSPGTEGADVPPSPNASSNSAKKHRRKSTSPKSHSIDCLADRGDMKKGEGHLPVASFPSVGLRGIQRTKSDMGVFLARRGDE